MTGAQGVLFLLVGAGIFLGGLLWLVARERRSHRPAFTVERFQRSRKAMRRLYRAQVSMREARRARARAAHPAGRRSTQPPATRPRARPPGPRQRRSA